MIDCCSLRLGSWQCRAITTAFSLAHHFDKQTGAVWNLSKGSIFISDEAMIPQFAPLRDLVGEASMKFTNLGLNYSVNYEHNRRLADGTLEFERESRRISRYLTA